MTPIFYRRAAIVGVGFDVTQSKPLEACDNFIQEVREREPNSIIVAVGNKIDLVDEREVTREEAREHFASMNPPVAYFETSAKTGEGVDEFFEGSIRIWIDTRYSSVSATNDNCGKDNKHKPRQQKPKQRNYGYGCIIC